MHGTVGLPRRWTSSGVANVMWQSRTDDLAAARTHADAAAALTPRFDDPRLRAWIDLAKLLVLCAEGRGPEARKALLATAQETISNDYVNGYLFQLARTGVANAKINGLWENAPTQANDLTGVSWSD